MDLKEARKEINELLNQATSEVSNYKSNKAIPEKLARQAEALSLTVKVLSNYKDAVNELCLKCGNYQMQHLGWCNDCRWKDEK